MQNMMCLDGNNHCNKNGKKALKKFTKKCSAKFGRK